MDRDKLAKLLALSASDNEHEALGCIRAANRIVKEAGTTWQDVLAGPDKSFRVSIERRYTAEENWVPPHLRDKIHIDLMFRAIFTQPRTSNEEFWQFIDSVHQWWTEKGMLTQPMYNAIKSCYKRIRPST
jgi:hypothetical protein